MTLVASLQAQPNGSPKPAGVHKPRPGLAQQHRPHPRLLLKVLSEQELAQLKAARQTIKGNPELVSARQAVKAAPAGETKQAARQQLVQVRRGLLLQADPSLDAVFDKIDTARASRKAGS